jgi:uncharacterized protein (DUF2249 family)
MVVNKDTKISKILDENPEAIEVIASINRNFGKLKNPFLRKMLAPRVSVDAAARVGGATVNTFLKALEKIGFEVEFDENNNSENQENTINMEKTKIVDLDVRPILESGVDPFNVIMDTLKTMKDDETLKIINTFEPIPLLNILKNKGYEYESERPEEGVVNTYLRKAPENAVDEKPELPENAPELGFDDLERKFAGKMIELDVRHLEMPMPMVSILESIENLDNDHALYVHHKRLPQYLLPELKQREFDYKAREVDEENMKLIIYRK